MFTHTASASSQLSWTRYPHAEVMPENLTPQLQNPDTIPFPWTESLFTLKKNIKNFCTTEVFTNAYKLQSIAALIWYAPSFIISPNT